MDIDWSLTWELFGFSFIAALLAGLIVPLVGCFLLLRRTSFYGIALPQFAAAGVAFGFAILPWWIAHVGLGEFTLQAAMEDSHGIMNYHLSWAALFTTGGLALLLFLGRWPGSEVARVAAAFAIASALVILFSHASPQGDKYVHELLHGDIIVIGLHELETICAVLLAALVSVLLFQRDLTLVSYDSETARVLGKPVLAFETLLALLTGLTIAAGVMTLGAVVLFGLLVLPPIAARNLARSMTSFFGWASALGVTSAAAGIWASFYYDWPLGAAVVAAASVPLLPTWLAARLRGSAAGS